MKETVVHDVTLRPGECLYIPAWWWMQSKSIGWKADKAMKEGQTESQVPGPKFPSKNPLFKGKGNKTEDDYDEDSTTA